MRKLFTILALLGLAVGISALGARADGVTVTYMVTDTYASNVPVTSVSAPGATFTFTFTVPLTVTGSAVSFGPTLTDVPVTFSSPTLPGFSSLASIIFATADVGGLFDLEAFPGGGDFDWVFVGPPPSSATNPIPPQLFMVDSTGTVATFQTGPFMIMGGTDLSGSFFFDVNDLTKFGDLTDGSGSGTSSVSAPEPSSLLLLGSGFLALSGFARRRLSAS